LLQGANQGSLRFSTKRRRGCPAGVGLDESGKMLRIANGETGKRRIIYYHK